MTDPDILDKVWSEHYLYSAREFSEQERHYCVVACGCGSSDRVESERHAHHWLIDHIHNQIAVEKRVRAQAIEDDAMTNLPELVGALTRAKDRYANMRIANGTVYGRAEADHKFATRRQIAMLHQHIQKVRSDKMHAARFPKDRG